MLCMMHHTCSIALRHQGTSRLYSLIVYILKNSPHICWYTIVVRSLPACIPIPARHLPRVGQNRISAPYMTVCMVISLLKIPYVHCIYL